MNKPKENRNEIKNKSLTVPMSQEEKDRISKGAKEMGITNASFVRVVLNDFFKKQE